MEYFLCDCQVEKFKYPISTKIPMSNIQCQINFKAPMSKNQTLSYFVIGLPVYPRRQAQAGTLTFFGYLIFKFFWIFPAPRCAGLYTIFMLKTALKYTQSVFFILTWVFIAYFLYANKNIVISFLNVKNPILLVLSLFLLFPSFWFQYKSREVLVKSLKLAIDSPTQLYILAHNGLLKYVPGGIWNQLDAVVMLNKNSQASMSRSTKLIFVEMFWRIAFGIIFFGPFMAAPLIALLLPTSFSYVWAYLIVCLGAGLSFYILRRYPLFYVYSISSFIRLALYNLAFWIVTGFSFALLLYAYTAAHFTIGQFLYVSASYVISWIGGFLFLPAPSGLGIREYLLGIFLEHIEETFIIGFSLSLVQRFLTLIRDVVVFGFSWYCMKNDKKTT